MKFFQLQLKIILQRLIDNQVHDIGQYEKYIYDNIKNFGKITLEFSCKKCGKDSNYFYDNIPIYNYIEFILYNPKIFTSYHFNKLTYENKRVVACKPLNRFECKKCGNRSKFNFTIF